MQPLIVATRNASKTREIQAILGSDFAVEDISARGLLAEITETGSSFEENAILKAIAVSNQVAELVMADDSGLEVDALDGGPGILSARYAGEKATSDANIRKLLSELAQRDLPRLGRSARFRCVIALAETGHLLRTFEGTVEGSVIGGPRGTAGFGYDPIFIPDGFGLTFAEIPAEEKNRISHRAKAIEQAKQFLRTGRR